MGGGGGGGNFYLTRNTEGTEKKMGDSERGTGCNRKLLEYMAELCHGHLERQVIGRKTSSFFLGKKVGKKNHATEKEAKNCPGRLRQSANFGCVPEGRGTKWAGEKRGAGRVLATQTTTRGVGTRQKGKGLIDWIQEEGPTVRKGTGGGGNGGKFRAWEIPEEGKKGVDTATGGKTNDRNRLESAWKLRRAKHRSNIGAIAKVGDNV